MKTKVLILVALLPVCLLAQRQDAPPLFRAGTELIQLQVSVLDRQRRPVKGLTAADFTVLDNGRPRPVRVFTPVDLPDAPAPRVGAAAWTREVAPDVATNQAGEQPGRLVVILMDRSIPHEGPTVTARNIATSIVESLGPNDLAALVATSDGQPQNFTADHARLIASIKQRDWATDSDKYPWGLVASLADGRCLCGLCVLDAITRIAEAVRPAASRARSLFFIGQGVIVQAGLNVPSSDPGCDRLVREARIKMFDAVRESGLVIHSIDPRGLASIGPQTRASTPGGPPLPEGVAAALRRQAQQDETNDNLAKQGTLHVLPDMTGGRTVVNRNQPEDVVPDIFRESQSYYLLAFEAGTEATSGQPRSIEVTVNRKDVRVSTQRQYVPPAPSLLATGPRAAEPADATPTDPLSGLLPVGRPPLKLALAAFANLEGSKAFLSVTADVRAFVREAGSPHPLQISVMAVDQTGKPVASAQQTSTISGLSAGAIDLPSHVNLPPGDYEVRVAVADVATGTTASVFSQVVVPDFAGQSLSLSDIALEWVPASPASAIAPVFHVGLVGPVGPTTERTIARPAHVQAFVEVYQGTTRSDAILPVSVRTQIVDVSNRIVDDVTDTAPADAFAHRRAAYRRLIPTERLTPGEYLLRVTATAGHKSAARAVRFTTE